jgi:hypothetical protein
MELLNKLKYFSICILALNIKKLIIKKRIRKITFLQIYLQREVFRGISCGIFSRIICGFVAGNLLRICVHFQHKTINYENISWEPESAEKSSKKVFI